MKRTIKYSNSQRELQPAQPSPTLTPQQKVKGLTLPPLREFLARRSSLHVVSSRPKKQLQGLDRFSLLRTIGTGTFARVKLARNKLTNEVVVLKVISKSWVLRRNQLNHVVAERKILSCLRDPFIVGYKCSFQSHFFLYLVLEYVQGGELYSLLTQAGQIDAHDAKIYACEVFSALTYLHSKRIVYRDLKPENLLITTSGHMKLADFGLAKIVKERTFTVCGTPQYMAPEVINGEGHDLMCDWWALGILLFEMISGQCPYEAPSPLELYEQILTAETQFAPDFPSDARNLVETLLEKDPSKRASKVAIRNSAYFAGVDWDQVKQLELSPYYRPEVNDPLDPSHFDKYPESGLPIDEMKPTEAALFADF